MLFAAVTNAPADEEGVDRIPAGENLQQLPPTINYNFSINLNINSLHITSPCTLL
jgi:hypothetical protein